ncbi:MAG: hypothetical protein AAB262_15565 [Elusimicrobiota bacterium]
MSSWALAAGLILAAAPLPAQESASPHYSNRSLGGGHAVATPEDIEDAITLAKT